MIMQRADFPNEQEYKEYLQDCADTAQAEALAHSGIGVALDPAVAELMGDFIENAID